LVEPRKIIHLVFQRGREPLSTETSFQVILEIAAAERIISWESR
jgi:hypothetical protein